MKNQEKIFQLIQEQLNHQKYYSNSEDVEIIDKNLLNFKESLEKKAQISKDQINQAIQKSMYYVIDEVEKIREKV